MFEKSHLKCGRYNLIVSFTATLMNKSQYSTEMTKWTLIHVKL